MATKAAEGVDTEGVEVKGSGGVRDHGGGGGGKGSSEGVRDGRDGSSGGSSC